MIEEISPEKEQKAIEYQQKALQMAYANGKANREVIEPLVRKFYRYAGLAEPIIVFFCESPLQAKYFLSAVKQNHKLLNEYEDNNDEFIKRIVKDFVDSNGVCDNFSTCIDGSHEAYWLMFYDFWRKEFKEEIDYGQEINEKLDDLITFANNGGWLYTFEKIAVVVDRQQELHVENDEISNIDGPAIKFHDGTSIYAVNGHAMPAWIIENPEKITVESIKKETNAEVKRVMIEKFGVSKYLSELNAKVIDADTLNLEGSSMRMLVSDPEGNQWLIGTDGSTGRVYHMNVSNTAKTCSEAHSEIAGFDETKCKFEC